MGTGKRLACCWPEGHCPKLEPATFAQCFRWSDSLRQLAIRDTQVLGLVVSTTIPEISMSVDLEALEAEVLKLGPADRSHLLERLIASLDADPEVEEAWEREADRREGELESGAVAAVTGHEAMARLRARLPK